MPASTLLRRPAVLLAIGLCAIAAVTTLLGRLTNGPAVETKPVTLPGTAGMVAYPAFSPDGNRLAYSQRGEAKADAFHVFVRRVLSGAPQQVTQGVPQSPANEISPAWSPDGASIAFLRTENGRAQLIVISADGGPERKIADLPAADSTQAQPRLAWTRDGKSLAASIGAENQPAAIALIDIANGAVHPITKPPEGTEGDWSPAISPDGSTLAFTRRGSTEGADLYFCDLAGGNLRRLTFTDRAIHGLAWMPNGSDIVYVASISGGSRLWRIAVNGGSPRDLFLSGDSARYPAVSPSHNRLVYTETPSVASIWRAPLDAKSPSAQAILRSSGREAEPAYSPDGKRIADISDQSGFNEIWVSDSEGGNRVQLTTFKGPQPGRPLWSPDGKWLLFDLRRPDTGGEVYKMLAEPGSKPVRVLSNTAGASWSHDGKWIYFGQGGFIWRASAAGGPREQLTERPGASGYGPVESLDGKFLYYSSRRGVWRVPAAGGTEEIAFESNGGWLQPAKKGLYYQEYDRRDRTMLISLFDYAAKKSSVVFRLHMNDLFRFAGSYAVSPDGKYVLYPLEDESQTNLKLVENFK